MFTRDSCVIFGTYNTLVKYTTDPWSIREIGGREKGKKGEKKIQERENGKKEKQG